MVTYRVTNEVIVEAMQKPVVRDALKNKAEKIASTHDRLADAEGSDNRARVESGTRPKGRPFSNVVVDGGAADEWGDSKTERRRRLGRASNTEQG